MDGTSRGSVHTCRREPSAMPCPATRPPPRSCAGWDLCRIPERNRSPVLLCLVNPRVTAMTGARRAMPGGIRGALLDAIASRRTAEQDKPAAEPNEDQVEQAKGHG